MHIKLHIIETVLKTNNNFNVLTKEYQYFNSFILRKPSRSLNFCYDLLEANEVNIESILTDEYLKCAIYAASIEFYDKILNYNKLNEKRQENVKLTLFKYLIRLSTRPTPFGLFSTCSIGNIEGSNYYINNLKRHYQFNEIDHRVLIKLKNKILNDENLRKKVTLFPNSTLYYFNEYLRYVEYYYENEKKKFKLENVKKEDYLLEVIKFCSQGEKYEVLVRKLHDYLISQNNEITYSEIEIYLDSLIRAQILITELEPSVNDSNYFKSLIDFTLHTGETGYDSLSKTLTKKIENLNSTPSINDYKSVENFLTEHLNYTKKHNIFKIDSYKDFENCSLPIKLTHKVLKGTQVLKEFNFVNENAYLNNFKNIFLSHYGEKEVPISIIFDEEIGLELNNKKYHKFDFIKNLRFKEEQETQITITAKEEFITALLYEKYKTAVSNSKNEIEITEKNLRSLSEKFHDTSRLSDTFSAKIELLDDDYSMYLSHAGGSTALNMISRFGVSNTKIQCYVDEIVKKEQQISRKKKAEILHLNQDSSANVLKNNVKREYEIPYLSNSKSNSIPIYLKDIYVKIENDQVILFSKESSQEIIPILSNAHNYDLSPLPLYQFLCELQYQQLNSTLSFIWPSFFNNFDFLPRVIYNDIILSKAMWKLKPSRVMKSKSFEELVSLYNIPRYVQINNDDNYLLLDTKNDYSFKVLKSFVKNKKEIILTEFLFNRNEGLNIDGKNYANEVLISFYKNVKND